MEGKQSVSDRIRHRTIMDMLQEDDDQASSGSKKSWKAFRDKLRLKKAGAAWTSTVPIPTSDIPIQTNTNRMMMRRGSARYPTDPNVDNLDTEGSKKLGHMDRQRSVRLLPVETDPDLEDEKNSSDGEKAPAMEEQRNKQQSQTSLMALLEDYGSNSVEDEVEIEHEVEPEPEPEEEQDDDDDGDAIGEYSICCGCRRKRKGAAFGPCGHTFCKKCTKERHVSRGNCPACNNYILEILDIY